MEKVVGNNTELEKVLNSLNSRECTLVIEFFEEEFSYTIFNDSKNEIVFSDISQTFLDFVHCTKKQLTTLFSKEKIFNYTFGKVKILINTHYSTLVPNKFFEVSKAKEILDFNIKIPKRNFSVLHQKLTKTDYNFVYINNKHLESLVKSTFINNETLSSNAILVDFSLEAAKQKEYFHLHIGTHKIQCFYFEKGKLLFNNFFICDNAEDMLYNLLNVFKQLNLNTEKTILHLSGKIHKESDYYKLLYKYIQYIEFLERPVKLNYSNLMNKFPPHFFIAHYVSLLA